MPVGPRIVFTRFAPRDAAKTLRWHEHTAHVTGDQTPVPAALRDGDGTAVVWSLVSGNNRELARGTRLHGQYGDAVDDAGGAIEGRVELEPRMVNDRALGGYGWLLLRAASPELVCSRWYDSDRDRRAALRAALAALAVATLVLGARDHTDPSDPRHHRRTVPPSRERRSTPP